MLRVVAMRRHPRPVKDSKPLVNDRIDRKIGKKQNRRNPEDCQ